MGSSPDIERKVNQNNPGARKWKDFYKKIETRGDREAENPEKEFKYPSEHFSQSETDSLVAKLNSIRHNFFTPRMLQSVTDQVFYVVESTRHNLNFEKSRPEWAAMVAIEMYQFYTALEEAVQSAKEVEALTGFSGAEVIAGIDGLADE